MAETYEFEDRTYIEPKVSRDEQLGFIDRLREIERKDLQKIATDTHNLGTDVASNLGGLSGIGKPNSLGISGADTGSAGIWRNRYERPQTNALVADLKATAQATALNTALNNVLKQYKNRYNQAARKAGAGGGGVGGGGDEDPYNLNVGDMLEEAIGTGLVNGTKGSYFVRDSEGNIKSVVDIITDANDYIIGANTPMFSYGQSGETGVTGAQYIQGLLDQGYSLWNSDGKKLESKTGL